MSYQVIARKWRPQTFAEIAGQEHVTRTLQNAIRAGRVAHAYIFSGIRGVGKTTTARVLAKALNCEHGPAAEPCNQCDRCREIAAATSLDVMEIDAASNRGIDQIRELREMVRYAPATGRYKVVILDEAHQLTEEASNALLKTLEEPPERVIFILATTAPESLPETIRSRAQHFHFRSLSFGEIAEALERVTRAEGLEIEPGAVAVLARAADGSLRDGLSLLEQALAYCDKTISDREVRELLGVVSEEALDEMVEAISTSSAERALALVDRIISSGQNLDSFCREAIRHVRNLLVVRVAGADSPMVAAPASERPRLQQQAERFSEEDLTRFFQVLLGTQADLRRHPDPRIHMEMGLLRMVNAVRLGPLEELLAELRGEGSPAPSSGSTPQAASPRAPSRGPSTAPGISPSRDSIAAPPPAVPIPAMPIPATPARERPAETAKAAPAPAEPSPEPEDEESSSGAGADAGTDPEAVGIEPSQVRAIRTAVREGPQNKLLDSLLDRATKWELASGELRLYFPAEDTFQAEMVQRREASEKLHAISTRILGQPLRVCAKLGLSRSTPAPPAKTARKISGAKAGDGGLRARFERDPAVQAVLERFGGRISGIKPAGGS
ncbi:MAG TPA: DNA polymerase III subunit gamma/tau [Candidatus Dormibacteraeota bacterium]|nr:DNA polymerase III subunit gamma/tau [Candidatus Dormibacteraeota bacterium]